MVPHEIDASTRPDFDLFPPLLVLGGRWCNEFGWASLKAKWLCILWKISIFEFPNNRIPASTDRSCQTVISVVQILPRHFGSTCSSTWKCASPLGGDYSYEHEVFERDLSNHRQIDELEIVNCWMDLTTHTRKLGKAKW